MLVRKCLIGNFVACSELPILLSRRCATSVGTQHTKLPFLKSDFTIFRSRLSTKLLHEKSYSLKVNAVLGHTFYFKTF